MKDGFFKAQKLLCKHIHQNMSPCIQTGLWSKNIKKISVIIFCNQKNLGQRRPKSCIRRWEMISFGWYLSSFCSLRLSPLLLMQGSTVMPLDFIILYRFSWYFICKRRINKVCGNSKIIQ